jgi:hypothetical protein
MEVLRTGALTPEQTTEVLANIPREDAKDLLARTHEYFIAQDGETVLAYGGLISSTFLSPEVYVWLIAINRPSSRRKIISALGLAQNYISSLGQRVFCEVFPTDRRGRHFAEVLGFKKILELDDRNVFEWSK